MPTRRALRELQNIIKKLQKLYGAQRQSGHVEEHSKQLTCIAPSSSLEELGAKKNPLSLTSLQMGEGEQEDSNSLHQCCGQMQLSPWRCSTDFINAKSNQSQLTGTYAAVDPPPPKSCYSNLPEKAATTVPPLGKCHCMHPTKAATYHCILLLPPESQPPFL